MKAVVFHGVGDIRLGDVPDPTLQAPRVIFETTSDLHRMRRLERGTRTCGGVSC